MAQGVLEQRVEHLEHRVVTVEQILPTLATKADLAELRNATKADLAELKAELKADWRADIDAAIAPLATKAELQAAIASLATKAELQAAIAPLATKAEVRAEIKAEGEQTRRHFDVVAEGLRADMRLLADGVAAGQASFARVDARHEDVMRVLEQHDKRLMRLEASQKRR